MGDGVKIDYRKKIKESSRVNEKFGRPFFALYEHSFSIGHSKQRVALPAAAGFADLRKCFREPNEETFTGVSGENQ